MTMFVKEYAPSFAEVANLSDNGIYEVTFITEGKGSTGYYSRELLETYGPKTFREGFNNYFNHIKWHESPEDRDLKTACGKILPGTFYNVEDGLGKVKGKIQIAPEHREFVEFFKENIGLSIFASGTSEYDEDTGQLNVTSFDTEYPYTSVDLVIAAGRGGEFGQKVESYLQSENADKAYASRITESFRTINAGSGNKPTVALAEETNNKKGNSLTKEEMAEMLKQVVADLVAEKAEKVETPTIGGDDFEKAVAEQVQARMAVLSAIENAELLDTQKDELRESVAKGEEVTVTMVEKEVKRSADLREAILSEEVSGQFSEQDTPVKEGSKELSKLTIFGGK